jgi:hypothetical protein
MIQRGDCEMLRQCVSISQDNWAIQLPAIEFALDSTRSSITGFSLFYLHNGRVPLPMNWPTVGKRYPGVRLFAQRIQDGIVAVHDSILAARVKQAVYADRKRRLVPFNRQSVDRNIALPPNCTRKLSSKDIGPYRIMREVVPFATF